METYLSKRGDSIKDSATILDDAEVIYQANKYNKETNPKGVINAGTAENVISADLVGERLAQVKTPFENNLEILRYQELHGLPEFRNTVASFLTTHANSHKPLDPDNLVILNGAGSCISALATVLCDPGDAWLIPAPYYCAVTTDTGRLPRIQLVHVDLTGRVCDDTKEPFELTVSKLEESLQQAKQKGINVRALFLMNPNNPLGTLYSDQLIRDCLDFAHRHKIHIILDEIYMFSTFQEGAKFTSVLSLDGLPDQERTHFIWGLSKDFCVSGLRCGIIYSWNQDVIASLLQLAYFFSIPTAMQLIFNDMLLDEDWLINTYLPTNIKRLRECYRFATEEFAKLGIRYIEGQAGLFIWLDFSKYISPLTFTAELDLHKALLDGGVYIPPGQAYYCSEPGWFRFVFALSKDQLQESLMRIRAVLQMQ